MKERANCNSQCPNNCWTAGGWMQGFGNENASIATPSKEVDELNPRRSWIRNLLNLKRGKRIQVQDSRRVKEVEIHDKLIPMSSYIPRKIKEAGFEMGWCLIKEEKSQQARIFKARCKTKTFEASHNERVQLGQEMEFEIETLDQKSSKDRNFVRI
ncbi:hypothetical protein D5086_027741 [Populus alba]|uniref:Uncharacterized protein n=1 Tax=Populus alba TaxID=43335 RepID=A0ACC4AW77_POPAL